MPQPSSSLLKTIKERYQPLSASQHAHWSLRPFTDLGFAAGWDTVPLGMSEIQPAAAALPLMFERDGPMVRPVALLRLSRASGGPLSLIDGTGRLLSFYTPALLRLHPFALRPAPWTGPLSDPEARQAGGTRADSALLCLDPESPWLARDLSESSSAPGAERLFDLNGAPTPALTRIADFFDQFRPGYSRAAIAATALQRAGLLRRAEGIVPEGAKLLTVDRAALTQFCAGGEDAAGAESVEKAALVAAMAQKGALELAYAQITSLQRVPHLEKAHVAWQGEDAGLQHEREDVAAPNGSDSARRTVAIDSFMDAMASSYSRDRNDYFDDEGT